MFFFKIYFESPFAVHACSTKSAETLAGIKNLVQLQLHYQTLEQTLKSKLLSSKKQMTSKSRNFSYRDLWTTLQFKVFFLILIVMVM